MALQKENPKFRLFKSYIIAFFWIGTAIFIDQITKYFAVIGCILILSSCSIKNTKYFAVAYLKNNHAKVLIDGVFELQYLENRGMAFGILQNKQFLFVVGALVICGAILLIYGRIPYTKKYMPLRICSILLIAGAVGNLIDRVRLNYVIDFFYFKLIDFPIFNVADCYVVVACIIFAFLILFYYKEDSDFDFLRKQKNRI